MMRHRASPPIITRINVTPIIDVALVLVIILLVTAPMMSVADAPVDLPQARTREAEDQRNVSVTLGADGRLSVDGKPASEQTLSAQIAARLAEPGNSDVLVVIRADIHTRYAAVRSALESARAAGAKHLAIATRQKTQVEP